MDIFERNQIISEIKSLDIDNAIKRARSHIRDYRLQLERQFKQGDGITDLIKNYTDLIDNILMTLWDKLNMDDCCLIAVGGYGRFELFPYSDIDIVILKPEKAASTLDEKIESFIQCIWDIHLEPGHIVGTLEDILSLSRQEITFISSLTDMRLLIGNKELFSQLRTQIFDKSAWSNKHFFEAKLEEQEERFEKYGDSAYNLQPDIKNGPGGLRDIQMIGWIVKWYFESQTLREIISKKLLTKKEFQSLVDGELFLWRVKLSLQLITKSNKRRMLFEHQIAIAQQFGMRDTKDSLAIEKFMQEYYQTVSRMRMMNDLIIAYFKELLFDPENMQYEMINPRFRMVNNAIDISHKRVFLETPSAIFELFLLLAQNPAIQNIRSRTLRLLYGYRNLINENFRRDPNIQELFLSILRQPINVSEQLGRMNAFGLLEKYIPAFSNVVGKMQYDLFHIYTVDQHSIFIVRNLRRFTLSTYKGEFPLCSDIISRISKPEVLYIAALFHDLGKGQGGDHSLIGANAVENFCQEHHLPQADVDLAKWLVEHHLLMSMTAQKRDIYDPITILQFVSLVENQKKLDHLYLLTVADICATNPALWNSWRNTLLEELYRAAQTQLSRENKAIDERDIVKQKKDDALLQLSNEEVDLESIIQRWNTLPELYFVREATANIVWQHKYISSHHEPTKPLVLLKQHHRKGGTEIFIYTKYHDILFAQCTTVLANLNLSLVEARINTTTEHYSYQTFVFLDEFNKMVTDARRLKIIQKSLESVLSSKTSLIRLSRKRTASTLKNFSQPPRISFQLDTNRQLTIIDIIAPDRPGLLASISRAFLRSRLHLVTAKIATLGERAEDSFYVTNEFHQPLDKDAEQEISRLLTDNLTQIM